MLHNLLYSFYIFMLQILYEVRDIRSLSKLYIPQTRKVKVTLLEQDASLSDADLAAIFPDRVIIYDFKL